MKAKRTDPRPSFRGLLPAFDDYGIEIVSTGGADATFQLNAFSRTAK